MTNQELKLLAEKATPGPWTNEKPSQDGTGFYAGTRIATTGPGCSVYADPPGGVFPSADRDFIAAANPKTVLDLLSQIERLQKFAAFAACTIKSGERWTERCQELLDEAIPPKAPEVQP